MQHEILGDVVKAARQRSKITIETLAERVNVTDRYLYRIENEGQKPSYDVLCKLIRELAIDPNLIFYPEKSVKDAEIEEIVRRLYRCDKRSIAIIEATVKAALENQPE
ncbi:MAG: helix-turn-helix domain-containing protein [Firmicutes bacterium]|nr:helix-turn-helix domain-containing protein [Bacillota bacterium]